MENKLERKYGLFTAVCMVAGIVMLGGILVYNMAIRLVPLLMRLLGSLFHFCTGKLRDLFRRAKEACYTL